VSPILGVRETRHIVGEYTLTGKDSRGETRFDDSIAVDASALDIHDPKGGDVDFQSMPPYEIPYRCLVPQRVEQILVAAAASPRTTRRMRAHATCPPACPSGRRRVSRPRSRSRRRQRAQRAGAEGPGRVAWHAHAAACGGDRGLIRAIGPVRSRTMLYWTPGARRASSCT
jgi:hypothetical protein